MTTVPLTPVDELGHWLDRPGEPNNVHLEAAIDAHVDAIRLRAALDGVLAAHPLARARLAPGHVLRRRLKWEIPATTPKALTQVRWDQPADLARRREEFVSTPVRLDTGPALRLLHAIGPERDVLLLSLHHAVFDGLSGVRLLRSLADRYAGRSDPVPDKPFAARIPRARPGPARVHGRPARIAEDGAEPLPGYGFHHLALPRPAPLPGPATVNDVLIAALGMAIAYWNVAHGTAPSTVRITMPLNTRPAGDERLGNLCRLASIAVTDDAANPFRRVLGDVTAQTTAAKIQGGPQLDPVSRALMLPWYPAVLRGPIVRLAHRMGAAHYSDTSLVSNLGILDRPTDFGPGAPVEAVWFSTPAPMPRGLSLGVTTMRGRMHLCLRYRHALFDAAAAARFAALLEELLAAAVPDPGRREAV
ncbi:condensation domain-containing protein [Amycolatopsis acidicola]|nr:condensation domain-containing protein [Amycolatopsis acidicola]